VEIKFNDRYHIVGADIKNYLLEKSRIVVPGQGERNGACSGWSCKWRTSG
jgi:myosin heavy subunit